MKAFGSFFVDLLPLADVAAWGLIVVELLLGVCMLLNVRTKWTTWISLLFYCVMTPLTLYIALVNPVSDCGCFGEAVHLSNTGTFIKNLFLLVAALVVFFQRKRFVPIAKPKVEWGYLSLYGVLLLSLQIYTLGNIPQIDFGIYKSGTDLIAQQQENQEREYETTFIYSKDGVEKTFTINDLPDSTWTFVDTRTVNTQSDASALPEITDFQMLRREDNEDITEAFLREDTYKFLLVSPHLEHADDGTMDRIAGVHDYCLTYGYPFYCLTASGDAAIERWTEMTGAEYPYCHTDDVVLKTMIRSNPGLMLLHGSVVVNKWPNTMLPAVEKLDAPLEQLEISNPPIESKLKRLFRLLLWYVLPLLAVTVADRLWLGKKMRELYKHRV